MLKCISRSVEREYKAHKEAFQYLTKSQVEYNGNVPILDPDYLCSTFGLNDMLIGYRLIKEKYKPKSKKEKIKNEIALVDATKSVQDALNLPKILELNKIEAKDDEDLHKTLNEILAHVKTIETEQTKEYVHIEERINKLEEKTKEIYSSIMDGDSYTHVEYDAIEREKYLQKLSQITTFIYYIKRSKLLNRPPDNKCVWVRYFVSDDKKIISHSILIIIKKENTIDILFFQV